MNLKKTTKIYIAGHRGMVGSAIWRILVSKGYTNLIGETSKELDLTNQQDVINFYHQKQPDVVIDAAHLYVHLKIRLLYRRILVF